MTSTSPKHDVNTCAYSSELVELVQTITDQAMITMEQISREKRKEEFETLSSVIETCCQANMTSQETQQTRVFNVSYSPKGHQATMT